MKEIKINNLIDFIKKFNGIFSELDLESFIIIIMIIIINN